MNKKTFDIIVKHKVDRVCKLYFEIQEKHREEFEEFSLFDSEWNMMISFATNNYDEIDSRDMNNLNRIWRTYNKYKKDGVLFNEWDSIDDFLKRGEKISAIKEYRTKHDCGLREAKDVVDKRQEELSKSWKVS